MAKAKLSTKMKHAAASAFNFAAEHPALTAVTSSVALGMGPIMGIGLIGGDPTMLSLCAFVGAVMTMGLLFNGGPMSTAQRAFIAGS